MKETGKHAFESGLERLEEISTLLDDERVPLEETIRLYEEGSQLAVRLGRYLEEAERRIKLAPVKADGNANAPDALTDLAGAAPSAAPARKTATRKKAGAPEPDSGLFG